MVFFEVLPETAPILVQAVVKRGVVFFQFGGELRLRRIEEGVLLFLVGPASEQSLAEIAVVLAPITGAKLLPEAAYVLEGVAVVTDFSHIICLMLF